MEASDDRGGERGCVFSFNFLFLFFLQQQRLHLLSLSLSLSRVAHHSLSFSLRKKINKQKKKNLSQ